jgi:hypothetical protein
MNKTLERALTRWGYSDTLVRWYYNHMANWRVNCDLSPVAKLRCPCQVWHRYHIADAFLGRSFCLEKFLARSLNPPFTGKLINLGENLLTLWELYLPFDQYLVLCKSFTFQKRIKTYLKWSCFFDWLSETKMIIVRVLFFRKTKSIVLLSFIVIITSLDSIGRLWRPETRGNICSR